MDEVGRPADPTRDVSGHDRCPVAGDHHRPAKRGAGRAIARCCHPREGGVVAIQCRDESSVSGLRIDGDGVVGRRPAGGEVHGAAHISGYDGCVVIGECEGATPARVGDVIDAIGDGRCPRERGVVGVHCCHECAGAGERDGVVRRRPARREVRRAGVSARDHHGAVVGDIHREA